LRVAHLLRLEWYTFTKLGTHIMEYDNVSKLGILIMEYYNSEKDFLVFLINV
jgi:hypothetical protein